MRNFPGISSRHPGRERMRISDPEILIAEGSPSNENQEGKVWGWNPNTRRPELRHPKIFFGPGALSSDVVLTINAFVVLAGSVPADGIGFRGGMVGYLPKGRYGLFGQVVIQSPSITVPFHVKVTQGVTEDDPVNRPRIMIGSTVIVGGGAGTVPATANLPLGIPFHASDIQVDVPRDYASEVMVWVYQEGGGAGAGSAKASTAQLGSTLASKMTFIRWDGQHLTS